MPWLRARKVGQTRHTKIHCGEIVDMKVESPGTEWLVSCIWVQWIDNSPASRVRYRWRLYRIPYRLQMLLSKSFSNDRLINRIHITQRDDYTVDQRLHEYFYIALSKLSRLSIGCKPVRIMSWLPSISSQSRKTDKKIIELNRLRVQIWSDF